MFFYRVLGHGGEGGRGRGEGLLRGGSGERIRDEKGGNLVRGEGAVTSIRAYLPTSTQLPPTPVVGCC